MINDDGTTTCPDCGLCGCDCAIPPGTFCECCEVTPATVYIDGDGCERGNYLCAACDAATDPCATYNDRTTAAFRAILTAIAAATDASVYGTVHAPGTYPGKCYDGAIMYVHGTERHGMLKALYTPSVRAAASACGCYVESVNCEVGAVFMTDAE